MALYKFCIIIIIIISVARWVKLLAAVSPSSECLYEGKADVVYLQVTVWSTSERLVVKLLTIGAIQVPVPFLCFRAEQRFGIRYRVPEPRTGSYMACNHRRQWFSCGIFPLFV